MQSCRDRIWQKSTQKLKENDIETVEVGWSNMPVVAYNQEQFDMLQYGAEKWNEWRKNNPQEMINFQGADLSQINFDGFDLQAAHFEGAILKEATFKNSNLEKAYFSGAILQKQISVMQI